MTALLEARDALLIALADHALSQPAAPYTGNTYCTLHNAYSTHLVALEAPQAPAPAPATMSKDAKKAFVDALPSYWSQRAIHETLPALRAAATILTRELAEENANLLRMVAKSADRIRVLEIQLDQLKNPSEETITEASREVDIARDRGNSGRAIARAVHAALIAGADDAKVD